MKKIALLITSTFLLVGCGSLLPKGGPAPRLYTLNALAVPKNADQSAREPLPVNLKVLKPQAAPGLETERIALRKNNNQIDYYADARWASDAATLLQSSLVESFEASRRLRSVSNDLVVLKSDYDVLIELRDFQADYTSNQAIAAHVRLTAKLINTKTEEIVKTFPYDQIETVKGSSLNDIVLAFDKAQQVVAQKLVQDVITALPTVVEPEVTSSKP